MELICFCFTFNTTNHEHMCFGVLYSFQLCMSLLYIEGLLDFQSRNHQGLIPSFQERYWAQSRRRSYDYYVRFQTQIEG
jgi:hypothetical protein